MAGAAVIAVAIRLLRPKNLDFATICEPMFKTSIIVLNHDILFFLKKIKGVFNFYFQKLFLDKKNNKE